MGALCAKMSRTAPMIEVDRGLVMIPSEEGSMASSHSTLPLDNRSPGSSQPVGGAVGGVTPQPHVHDVDSSSDEDDGNEFERRAQASRERDRNGVAESVHFPRLGGSTPSVVGGPPSFSTFGGMPSTIGSSGSLAFKDPTAPTRPKDSRPLWKIQEARRR